VYFLRKKYLYDKINNISMNEKQYNKSEAIKNYNQKVAEDAIKNNSKLAGGTTPEEQGERNASAVELMTLRLAQLKASMNIEKSKVIEQTPEELYEAQKLKFKIAMEAKRVESESSN
jgi:hypothetical protein